jgi:hypothetical protein
MALNPAGLGPEKDCAGEVQQQLKTTDPTTAQREPPKSTNAQLSKDNLKT